MNSNQSRDLTGRRFGKLLVLGKGISKGPGRTTWRCRCDCGRQKDIRADALKRGATTSCGMCRCASEAKRDVFRKIAIPLDEIKKSAKASNMTFGEYIAKEYVRRTHGRRVEIGEIICGDGGDNREA